MESIRRRIKIFWLDHRDPILFYTIMIAGIIIIVQILNQIAISRSAEKEISNNIHIKDEQYSEYKKEDKKLIETFIEYCKENNIEKAYSLLSNNCKTELYPTINDFRDKYYNKRFKQKTTIKIKYNREKGLYNIYFYPDILESGKYIDDESVVDYFNIEQGVLEAKININYK